jgi:protein-S-isoprenylcysteine O-methyltransferase Ste14
MTETVPDTPGVMVPPPLLYAGAFVAVLVLRALRPLPLFAHGGGLWVGLALVLASLGFGFWGRAAMISAGTNVDPRKPTTTIVETGAFRFTRNPLYVGMAVVFVGLTLCANTLWGLVLLVPVALIMHHGVILREERYLEFKFGDAYRRYRARVRRYV